jgi:hypothetical protein
MKHYPVTAFAILLAFAIGCNSSNTLTRNKAKELLRAYFTTYPQKCFFVPTSQSVQRPIKLMPEEIEAGHKAGYWPATGPALAQHFGSYGTFYYGALFLSKPEPARVVDVTGITDAPTIEGGSPGTAKVVDATWRYDLSDFPPQYQAIFKNHWPQPFHASLRLYDDGWRVESVEVSLDELYSMK